jgi:hypothetical protein
MEPPRAARAVSPAGREPSRHRAADRPPGHGSLRIAPAEIRSYSGLIRLISHTVVENEHRSTRLRDD